MLSAEAPFRVAGQGSPVRTENRGGGASPQRRIVSDDGGLPPILETTTLATSSTPRSLLVASTGGHLMQLTRLYRRLELAGDPLWVTFDSPQSRSLLAGEAVEFVRFTSPRDVSSVVRNVAAAAKLLRQHDVREVISTGSGVALSFIPLARMLGIPCHYIESAARSAGPSLTGKTLVRIPGVHTYTQYAEWAGGRWALLASVLDEFVPGDARHDAPCELRVLVALGTIPYRFDGLVDAMKRAALPSWQMVWQVGPNRYDDLPGSVHSVVDAEDFAAMCREADVIVSHAGVGTALAALEAGKHPLLVARRVRDGQHVDDHQRLVGAELSARGLASLEPLESVTAQSVVKAAQHTVRRGVELPTIRLTA